MKYLKENLPLLLKRTHIIHDVGFSDTLYYSLVKNNILPIVKVNGRNYIHRDSFFKLLESGSINTILKESKIN